MTAIFTTENVYPKEYFVETSGIDNFKGIVQIKETNTGWVSKNEEPLINLSPGVVDSLFICSISEYEPRRQLCDV